MEQVLLSFLNSDISHISFIFNQAFNHITMKNLTINFLLIMFLGSQLHAQTAVLPTTKTLPKWKMAHINFGLGIDHAQYNSMSLNDVLAFAKNPEELSRDLSGLSEEVNTQTAGLAIYTSFSFNPLNKKTGTYKTNQELRIGAGMYSPKEAMVSYKDESKDTSIVYCNRHGELGIDGSYRFMGQAGKRKRFHWSVGLGLNAGLTFSNEMIIIQGHYFEPGLHPSTQRTMDTEEVRYEAKPVYYLRPHIPVELHYQLTNKMTMGLNFRPGVGIQKISKGNTNFIPRTGAMIIGFKCLLN